jgi:eukaryotic-like serine/threonine-protein kinase
MAAVVHPNLAVIYGIEAWKSTPVLIVEFLDGGTLADRLRQGPLPAIDVVDLGRVLADALERIHAAGILHRDVKPSNIGYTAEAVPKLLDFGLARMVGEHGHRSAAEPPVPGQSLTNTEGIVGTPLYMSPEALWNEPPDASFDLWSLAVVLVEAATGHHPFQRSTWPQTLDAITRAEIVDATLETHGCTPQLVGFFKQALNRDRNQRPGSAGDLKRQLQRLAA